MLSHFMGGCNRHNVKELWLAQRRLDQLADAVGRARRQAQETIAARDRKISELEHALSKARQQIATTRGGQSTRAPGAAPSGGPRRPGAERGGRRLAAARARLTALEAENQRLQALLGVLIETAPPKPTMAPEPDPIRAVAEDGAPQLEGRCILYVGGRCQLLPHLRARAASWKASLLHHDGGQEESLQSLGGLVDRADVVLCPIDCVSHQACLKVKGLCRRRAKPFVPLRSSSATCFTRAIRALHGGALPVDARPFEPNSGRRLSAPTRQRRLSRQGAAARAARRRSCRGRTHTSWLRPMLSGTERSALCSFQEAALLILPGHAMADHGPEVDRAHAGRGSSEPLGTGAITTAMVVMSADGCGRGRRSRHVHGAAGRQRGGCSFPD